MAELAPEQRFEHQKTWYFGRLGIQTKEALRLHQARGMWDRNEKGERDWGNVSEHCLAEVARVFVVADVLGFSEETKRKLMVAAALHDFNKKDEMTIARKAYAEGQSVWEAFEEASIEKTRMMQEAGFSPDVIRLANAAPYGSIPETEEVLQKDTLTEEDVAFLLLHYVDDISRGANWVAPVEEDDGKRVNELDRRLGRGVGTNPVYMQLNEEGKTYFNGATTWEAALRVGQSIEERLTGLISQNIGQPLDPKDLPEFIDKRVRQNIEATIRRKDYNKEVAGMYVEALSVGKHKNSPELNEDGFVITEDTFAVIDGSTPRIPILFDGKSGGRFAAEVVKDVLETTESHINGEKLVELITTKLRERMDAIGVSDSISQSPDGRPAALFTVARMHGDRLIITALGDVHCRVNGQIVHEDHLLTEDIMIEKRIAAMRDAKAQNEDISDEELRSVGRAAIEDDLQTQVRRYFNNPDNPLGLGIIDGDKVPEKFIKIYMFNKADVHTLEIFSDGYYLLPEVANIEVWEKAFLTAEKEDPLRWEKYPAVKASTPEQFSDDRTILIAKAK